MEIHLFFFFSYFSDYLKPEEIEACLSTLEAGEISKDEVDIGDKNELDYYPGAQKFLDDLADGDQRNLEEVEEENLDPPVVEEEPGPSVTSSSSAPLSGTALWRSRNRDLIWKKKNLEWDEDRISFMGNTSLPREVSILETALDFFSLFINEEIIAKIVTETNLYITQNNIANCPPVTSVELRQFLGILIFTTVFHYPNVRSYWGKYGFQHIMETMSSKRFAKLRSVIHFNDNSLHKPITHPEHDRLHKIRSIISHLNQRFSNIVPLEQRLSLDEQMCATKVAHFLKQYLPNKPHKWGFKFYVLCSLSGYAYNFEIYSGKNDNC